MKPFFAFAISLFLFTSLGWAQQPELHRVKFSLLSWKAPIFDISYQNANGDIVTFNIPNGAPSKAYEYMGTLPIVFFKIKGKDEQGQPIRDVVATFTPSTQSEQLLIFIPQDDLSDRFRILPVDFSPEGAPVNSYRFLNLSTFPVYVRFGESQFKINSREEELMTVDPSQFDGMQIAMAIQVSEQPNDAKIAYSRTWPIRNGRSALVFLTNEMSADERIDVKRLYY